VLDVPGSAADVPAVVGDAPSPPATGSPFAVAPDSENPYQAPAAYTATGDAAGAFGPLERQPFVPTIIDVGDIINRAWRIFTENMGPCILVTLSMLGLSLGAVVALMLVVALVMPAVAQGGGEAAAIVGGLMMVVMFPLLMLLVIWIQVGMTIFYLKLARGQPAEVRDIFSGGPYLLPYLGVSILLGLMVTAGMLACVVPGVLLALMFYPCTYLVIDRDASVGESFGLARQATEGNKMSLFLLMLVAMGISMIAGFVPCGIGHLFAMPLMMLIYVVAYLSMTGQPTAGAVRPQQSVISDP